jgi:hypothetical protein
MEMYDKARKFMLEWAEQYYRSRDAFSKKILSIDNLDGKLVVNFKENKETILSVPDLEQTKEVAFEQNTSIVTLNNRKNIYCLHSNWQKLSQNNSLKIYFINPFSTTDKKWIINPFVHSRICDESTLRTGLIAMFETVEPLTIDILEKKLGAVQS